MKKVLGMFVVVLIFFFAIGVGTQSASAAEKAKYGGILKFNTDNPAGIIGDPLKIMMWNHIFSDVALQCLLRPSNTRMGDFEPELATSWKLAPDRSNPSVPMIVRHLPLAKLV